MHTHKFATDPLILQDCKQNPSLQKCNLNCFDVPTRGNFSSGSLGVLPQEDSNASSIEPLDSPNNFWPPLSSSQWIVDTEFCQAAINTTFACFQNKYRFAPSREETLEPYSSHEACLLLKSQNVTHIHIVGGSLMRHFAQGMLIVLDGNPNRIFGKNKACVGDNSFHESKAACRDYMSNTRHKVCNDTIHVFMGGHNPRRKEHVPKVEDHAESNLTRRTLHFYGIGNHLASGPHSLQNRYGILNSKEHQRFRWNSFTTANFCGNFGYFIWVPAHFKYRIGRTDETNQRAHQLFCVQRRSYVKHI